MQSDTLTPLKYTLFIKDKMSGGGRPFGQSPEGMLQQCPQVLCWFDTILHRKMHTVYRTASVLEVLHRDAFI